MPPHPADPTLDDPADLSISLSAPVLRLCPQRAALDVTLVPECMAQIDLEAGRLCVLLGGAMPMAWDYMLDCPRSLARRPPLRAMVGQLAGH